MSLSDTQWIEWYMRENPYCTREAANRALRSYKDTCAKIRYLADVQALQNFVDGPQSAKGAQP